MFTKNHTIGDVLDHPLGHDLIRRILIFTGGQHRWLANPLARRIPLSWIPRLSLGKADGEFIEALLQLLNSHPEIPPEPKGPLRPAWWKEAVFYQIYPRSFKDSDGDGVGDLRGVLEQLDYLQDLGVDAIWLSPVYDSPMEDNGYDIRNYRQIHEDFGTMSDFEALLDEVHLRGMRLIMDLVVNHTSDEHPWFQAALKDPASPYRDYYFFRSEPNNWTSYFGDRAWSQLSEQGEWVLHLFSPKQMDLNWENPAMRRDIAAMVRSWLDRGIDGFRLDVINYISKVPGLPPGNRTIGDLTGYTGVEHYFYGPRLHEYLHELHEAAFAPACAFSVGETPGIGRQAAKLLTAPARRELDMIFSFDHLENPGKSRFEEYRYDLNELKGHFIEWLEDYDGSWMSLFYENHDNRRMISKVDPDPSVRVVLAKLLGLIQMTLKGTPFLYQGQELGLVDSSFGHWADLRDVESLNLFEQWRGEMGDDAAFQKVLAGSRDHARIPMPWTGGPNGGFSSQEPWIALDERNQSYHAEGQLKDPDSVLSFYRDLIRLRREHAVLRYGDITFTDRTAKNVFCYVRQNGRETLHIQCNLSNQEIPRPQPGEGWVRLAGNYPDLPQTRLRPYEAGIWLES